MDQLTSFLQTIRPLNPETAQEISSYFLEKTYKKGELFLREGQVSNEYFYLESGLMRSYLYDTDGNEVTLNFYGAIQPVFEVSSLFQRIPSEEYIEAITVCHGRVITFEKLNFLFHNFHDFREIGRAILVRGFIQFKKRTFSMINKTADVRYTELMQTNPEIFQHASLKHIASYLGITDTSLSRIRREFIKR